MTSPENVGQQFQAIFQAKMGELGHVRVGDLVGNPKVKYWDYDVAKTGSPEKDLRESKTSKKLGLGRTTLYDSIKEHGVADPIHLGITGENEVQVQSGHHRIAAAHDINPDMQIPYRVMPKNMVLPGFMSAKGNCPSCYGDGTDWEEGTDEHPGVCSTCKGNGWVKETE
jgi:DnaJ-class molecular chaperone